MQKEYYSIINRLENSVQINSKNLLFNVVKLGIRLGIIQSMFKNSKMHFSLVQNRNFLKDYINVLIDSKIATMEGDNIVLLPFDFYFTSHEIENSIPEYLTMYDYIASMAHYRAISEKHPNILMSFGKDADVWDIFLDNPFCRTYRKVSTDFLELKNGDKVLDVGCGSISPVYFSEKISPNGFYRGIENSRRLATLATKRLKRKGHDWADINNSSIEDLFITTKYDTVICTDMLNYINSPTMALKNMLKALKKGGEMVIFDTFPDLVSFNLKVYEFYNHLNPSFRGLMEANTIIDILKKLDNTLRIEVLGKSFIVVHK